MNTLPLLLLLLPLLLLLLLLLLLREFLPQSTNENAIA